MSEPSAQKNKKGREKRVRRDKKEEFVRCWAVNYAKISYDARKDPHATYYFMSKSVSSHLKELKKVRRVQYIGDFP
jgi:hypothetical protein